MPQALLLLALVFATFLALRRRPVVGFLAFTFFAILSPSSSVVPLITQTAAEHRMYLPLAAVVILAVFSVHRTLGNRAGLLLGLLVSAALGTSTIARNRTLQDEMALWTDTIAKAPTNPRAHASLGLALSDRGRAREAIPHFLRALELQPTSVATEQNLGNAYFQLRDFTTAAAHFRRAVALDPKFASGYNNLGATLRELGDNDAALRQYQLALSLDPQHAGAHQNAGRLFFALGRFAEAAAHYKQVQQAQPQSGKANYDLGVALAQAGEIEGAIRYFNLALQLDPSASSYFNYARFLVTAGRPRDAIDQLETALRLRPDFPEARRELDRLRGK